MSAEIREFPPAVTPKAPKSAEQLGILVLDGSGSMNDPDAYGRGTKAEAVGKAVQELVGRLQKSSRKQDFWLALIVFDNNVEVRLQPTPVTDIDGSNMRANPYLGGSTAIGDALYAASQMADDFLTKKVDLPRSVVIMLMSDGQNNTGRDPRSVINDIKKKWSSDKLNNLNIVSVAYGADADRETLKAIVTNPEKDFCETDQSEKLRDFFLGSIVRRETPT